MTAPTKAYVGQDVNLYAQVTPAVQGGTVEFTVDGGDKVTGTVGSDGVAVAPYTFTATGTHSVVARYSGTAGVAASVAPAYPVSVTNAPAADVQTTTTLAPVGTVVTGQPVTLTASVVPSNATGTVQFKLGDEPLGAPVPVVNGTATLPTTFAGAGTFNVTAEFVGSAGFIDSASAPQTLTVPGVPARASAQTPAVSATVSGTRVRKQTATTNRPITSTRFHRPRAPLAAVTKRTKPMQTEPMVSRTGVSTMPSFSPARARARSSGPAIGVCGGQFRYELDVDRFAGVTFLHHLCIFWTHHGVSIAWSVDQVSRNM
ncbi:Ig-like domain-containing protein [Rhodococcus sp. NPDC003318]|uniref:Ig-like domain-containing protein n=1 Tax=Rhodococcus sp. NPDC003318 TaxID=3364503 RepID=UPI00368E6BBE